MNVSYNGFYDSCPINGLGGSVCLRSHNQNLKGLDGTFQEVEKEGWQKTVFFQYDYNLSSDTWNGFNRHFAYGRRYLYGKNYQFGLGWSIGFNRFVAKAPGTGQLNVVDRKTQMRQMQFRLEALQRIPIRSIGINWDLGAYGGINITRRVRTIDNMTWLDGNGQALNPQPYKSRVVTNYKGCKAMNLFEYGATTRLSYNIQNMINIGVYANYRLSDIITKQDFLIGNPTHQPSPWSFGIEFEIIP